MTPDESQTLNSLLSQAAELVGGPSAELDRLICGAFLLGRGNAKPMAASNTTALDAIKRAAAEEHRPSTEPEVRAHYLTDEQERTACQHGVARGLPCQPCGRLDHTPTDGWTVNWQENRA